MDPEEIKDWMRGDIRRTLEAEGVPQHEQDELIEHHLASWLAIKMGGIIWSLRVADKMMMPEGARQQIWHW